MSHRQDSSTLLRTLKFYLNPNDGRYEDLAKGNLTRNIIKDLTAGLVVAMVAIPLAMGFAMASGLRPEQGIVGGAVAGLLGALFGGSKYQVYGPTAAYIPIIAGLMATYNHSNAYGETNHDGMRHQGDDFAFLKQASEHQHKASNDGCHH